MPSLIDLRRRIRAVKNTQQITKAMKMIAASRLRRAHDRIVAARPAGLFYGVQTMRQLLPPSVEHIASYTRRLVMPAAHVVDAPRFEWRGVWRAAC